MELQPLRGFQDWLGAEARAFTLVETQLRALMRRYHFDEIRTPMLERSELYQRSSGETSDIVEKQMYAFTDSDEAHTSVALRPEGTPSVVRAYIDAGLDRRDPEQRFFYNGPVFRRERPQKGRYRQHVQFGVEVFGRADPACDAELLIMVDDLRRELGVTLRFEINSIGDAQCRPAYREALVKWGREHLSELCEDCHNRIDRNPLRLLDCKNDVKLAATAPKSIDYLCEPCSKHFSTVRELLTAAGVEHRVNPQIVRGLDYYTRTTFEVISDALGAQSTVVGGGRYDGLVELMGGAPVPGIGFGLGVDRWVLMLLEANKVPSSPPDVAVVALGAKALTHSVQLAHKLREAGIAVDLLSPERKLKALLTRADKIGARFAIIVGDNEIERGVLQLRDLRRGEQREVADSAIASELTAQLRAG